MEVFVNASPFLEKLINLTQSAQSFELQVRFQQVIALNTATLLDEFPQLFFQIFFTVFHDRRS